MGKTKYNKRQAKMMFLYGNDEFTAQEMTLNKVSTCAGIPHTLIYRWNKKENWVKEKELLYSKVKDVVDRHVSKELALLEESKMTYLDEMFRTISAKVIQLFTEAKSPDEIKSALKATGGMAFVETIIKNQRLMEDKPTEFRESKLNLSNEELASLDTKKLNELIEQSNNTINADYEIEDSD